MTSRPASFRAALIVILSALAVCPAGAQVSGPSLYERQDASQPAANRLPALLMDVGIGWRLRQARASAWTVLVAALLAAAAMTFGWLA